MKLGKTLIAAAAMLSMAATLILLLLPGLAAPPIDAAGLMLTAGASWGVYSLLGRSAGDPTAATGGNFLRTLPFAAALMLATVLPASSSALFSFSGTSVLIGVGVALETMKQVDSQLMMRNYEGFLS